MLKWKMMLPMLPPICGFEINLADGANCC